MDFSELKNINFGTFTVEERNLKLVFNKRGFRCYKNLVTKFEVEVLYFLLIPSRPKVTQLISNKITSIVNVFLYVLN